MVQTKTSVVIIGAAGMDYHVFNRVYRDNPAYDVKAFTMAVEQNLGTVTGDMRAYPASLAGKLYPHGIPTIPESQLKRFVEENHIQLVVLAYSDIAYPDVMHKASIALAAGADFRLISPHATMIQSTKPVIGVCAVRTGCGKSQTSRKLVQHLKAMGLRVVAVREPMPYGDLEEQVCMRFETYDDLNKYKCTIEEREEYEQYVERGLVIYSGVDYEVILRACEAEADVIVWDGGNNEVPFFKCDVLCVVADPLRPGHEKSSYPGEVNVRMADYFVISKENTADPKDIEAVARALKQMNPIAPIVHADSLCVVADADIEKIAGKRVLVVEDGPTLTHGNMAFGAGIVAARDHKVGEIVKPQPFLPKGGNLENVFKEFPQLVEVLPAMGYSAEQLAELEATINACDCDVVLAGTPMDLAKVVNVNKPVVRVTYSLRERGDVTLKTVLDDFKARTGF